MLRYTLTEKIIKQRIKGLEQKVSEWRSGHVLVKGYTRENYDSIGIDATFVGQTAKRKR